jgi:hypothetical protein
MGYRRAARGHGRQKRRPLSTPPRHGAVACHPSPVSLSPCVRPTPTASHLSFLCSATVPDSIEQQNRARLQPENLGLGETLCEDFLIKESVVVKHFKITRNQERIGYRVMSARAGRHANYLTTVPLALPAPEGLKRGG